MALFNRTASILIDNGTKRVIVRNVRIQFLCEKSGVSTKNSATIRIFNLAKLTRDAVNTKETKVTLNAGYIDDVGEQILFVGDVTYVKTDFRVPDLITELELKDTHNKLRDARLNQSFKAGTTGTDIVKKLTNALNIPAKISADLSAAFANGLSVSGLVGDSLTKILKKYGVDWAFTDEQIEILEKSAANSTTAIKLNSGSGLVGIPSFVIDDKNELPDEQNPKEKLNVTSLLIPTLNPFGTIKLESREFNGFYRIDRVRHSGDTRGDTWRSESEVTAL